MINISVYVIVDVLVSDTDKYEEYKKTVPELIKKHGGEYLVRGGNHEVIEGAWSPARLVVFKFPSKEAVHQFYEDPEYQPLKNLRHQSSESHIVVVDGWDGQ